MTTRRQGQGPGGGPFTYGLQFQTTSEWGIDRRPSYAACLPYQIDRLASLHDGWHLALPYHSAGTMHARSLLVASLAAGPAADADMQAPYGGRAGPSRTRPPRHAAASREWNQRTTERARSDSCVAADGASSAW